MKKALLIILFIGLTKIVQAQGPIKIYWTSVYKADTGMYPSWEKDQKLLKTAKDLQNILFKATGEKYAIDTLPNPKPATGIFLIADSTVVTDNMERCHISSDSLTYLTFTAKHAHGVNYGVYEYLNRLGCKFYLPDTLWEIIPQLQTPFSKINEFVAPQIRMRNIFMTGGLLPYPVDSTNQSSDAWSLWVDRNNMRGEYEISGHNDWDDTLRKQMKLLDCPIAEFDSSIVFEEGSVVNVENPAALETWANWMTQNWINNKKGTQNDPFINHVRSIDLTDGARYGNTNIHNCVSGNGYDSPSNQRFRIENRVTEVMQLEFPGAQTWCLSYDLAADTPSVKLHDDLNISVTMGYQTETSNIALMKRWLHKMKYKSKLSEYNYMAMPYYGQYPYNDLDYFKNVYNRIKNEGTAGTLLELGIAKFSTAMHIYTFNEFAKSYKDIDQSKNEFIDDMFGGASGPISELFDLWTNQSKYTTGSNNADNKHRYPKYLKLLEEASALAAGLEKKRVSELKAYMHYIILNDKFINADSVNKRIPAENLVRYIVQISKTNIINAYACLFAVANTSQLIVNKDTSFYFTWNPNQSHYDWDPALHLGTYAPIWGQIPFIDEATIEADFQNDLIEFKVFTNNYTYLTPNQIISKITQKNLKAKSIVNYTVQTDVYPTQTAFSVYAPSGGFIRVMYDKLSSFYNNDVIFNFSLESDDQLVVVEKRINSKDGVSGFIDIPIEKAGHYLLGITKPTYGGGEFKFITNGNYMFRNGSFYPTFGETYTSVEEAASYVYVPTGTDKVYLSIMSACGVNCGDSSYFNQNEHSAYRNQNGDTIMLHNSGVDSTLFYLPVAEGSADNFWQINHKEGNNHLMSLANINNYFFWLEPASITGTNKEEDAKWAIFPNPSHGSFNVLAPNNVSDASMTIVDVLGRTVFSSGIKFSGNTYQANLDIPTGLYIINLKYGDQTVVKKWINK